MTTEFMTIPDDQLRCLLKTSRRVLHQLTTCLSTRPDIQQSFQSLMEVDDMLVTFGKLAEREPELMRILLQASVTAVVNMQNVENLDAELKRRSVAGN